jgi:hypothetical protein
VRQAIQSLPITPRVLANLRETARLFSTHYSTMIEGNRLTQEQVFQVIGQEQHFPGRDRDEGEVKGCCGTSYRRWPDGRSAYTDRDGLREPQCGNAR